MTGAPGRLAAALADRYRIEHELGAGGMATVYLGVVGAVGHGLRRPEVACALLDPGEDSSEPARDRLTLLNLVRRTSDSVT